MATGRVGHRALVDAAVVPARHVYVDRVAELHSAALDSLYLDTRLLLLMGLMLVMLTRQSDAEAEQSWRRWHDARPVEGRLGHRVAVCAALEASRLAVDHVRSLVANAESGILGRDCGQCKQQQNR